MFQKKPEFHESSFVTLPVEWSHDVAWIHGVFMSFRLILVFTQAESPSPSGDETLLVLRSVVQG